ncbi:D-alanyl-D-alanine carboxypeptidase dacD precursor [Pantoea agglomerans]|uniref:D-alanyl-D-alanine carboxypeptidase dacD n=1 Tax=Enterobacter agglomerans TaxID=549 RepID=A0A379AES5_ENTAG|nr:D-alanyl-D-alanine carboxypeptidase dacD precursor [Pantoea agglomerans]
MPVRKLAAKNVWYGNPHQVDVGTAEDVYLSLPRSEVQNVKAKYVIDRKDLEAPLKANEVIGEIQVMDKDQQIAHYPLVALSAVEPAGVITPPDGLSQAEVLISRLSALKRVACGLPVFTCTLAALNVLLRADKG